MEDYGYMYIHKLPQFITTLKSRQNSSIDMRPNTVKNCDFMSIIYSKPLREYKKHTFKTGDRVRISECDLFFPKRYKQQSTREFFEVVAIATRKRPIYTIKDEHDEIIPGKFYQKELIKFIEQWICLQSCTIDLVSNDSGELFPDNTLISFHNFLTKASKHGRAMGRRNFRKILPINVPKNSGGNLEFFDEKLSKSTTTNNLEPGLHTSITDIVEALNTLLQERNNHKETSVTVKVSRRTQKIVVMLANDTSGLAFRSTDLVHIFGNNVGNEFGY